VKISAETLEPGSYEGLLLTSCSTCTDCAQIHLTVFDAPTDTDVMTWGVLKHRFANTSR